MKSIDIALKDLTRSFRSAIAVVFMFGIPLLVTAMFALMFGTSLGGGGFTLARTRVVIANLDDGRPRLQMGRRSLPGGIHADSMSELVVEVLRSDEMAELLEVSMVPDAEAARAAVDNRQADVAVILPVDFSRSFADQDTQAVIEFYQDPTLTLGPGIVKSILNQFMDGLSGVKIAVDVAMDQLKVEDYALLGEFIQRFLDSAMDIQKDPAAALLDEHMPGQKPASKNSLGTNLGPLMGAMIIFYAYYTGTASAESILREEEEGTMPRLFTTPTPQSTILTGKFLAVFLTAIIQFIVMIIAGRVVFGIRWGEAAAVALMAVGVVVSAATFGIFVNSFMKNTKQGGIVFGGILTFSGMLGMLRLFAIIVPGTSDKVNIVSLFVPQGWAIRGMFQAMSGVPPVEVLLNDVVLLAWSILFFSVGVWRFNRRYA